ncbi:hypothetical protein EV715DRAFT_265865 [Schizophyllum commune]
MIITGKALSDANDVQLQQYALRTRVTTETSKPAHALVLTYTDVARTKNGLFQETAVPDEDMFATTALCDRRARTILDFGTALQNFIAFSLLDRLVAIPGVGDFAGIRVLDRVVLGVERNLLDSVGDATAAEWSATIVDDGDLPHSERLPRPARPFGAPKTNVCESFLDGRFLNTTTLSSYLRVGSGVLLSTAPSPSVAPVVAQSKLATAPVKRGGEGVPATEDGGRGAAERLRAFEELDAGVKRSKGLEATQTRR